MTAAMQDTRQQELRVDAPNASAAALIVKIIERLPKTFGESSTYWRPYTAILELEGLKITAVGNHKYEYGLDDMGTIKVETKESSTKQGKEVTTFTKVAEFRFKMLNGSQVVLKGDPHDLVPEAKADGTLTGSFFPGDWTAKLPMILSEVQRRYPARW